jgi:hypothetical protein
MIATAHATRTATDWVRLGKKRIAILVGPVEQVEFKIAKIPAALKVRAPVTEL